MSDFCEGLLKRRLLWERNFLKLIEHSVLAGFVLVIDVLLGGMEESKREMIIL